MEQVIKKKICDISIIGGRCCRPAVANSPEWKNGYSYGKGWPQGINLCAEHAVTEKSRKIMWVSPPSCAIALCNEPSVAFSPCWKDDKTFSGRPEGFRLCARHAKTETDRKIIMDSPPPQPENFHNPCIKHEKPNLLLTCAKCGAEQGSVELQCIGHVWFCWDCHPDDLFGLELQKNLEKNQYHARLMNQAHHLGLTQANLLPCGWDAKFAL